MSELDIHFDRRRFVIGGVTIFGGLSLISDRARAMSGLSSRAIRATEPDKTLLLIELSGGNDGLSTIVPMPEEDLFKARRYTGLVKEGHLAIDDYRALHPNLKELYATYKEGGLGIIEGVGYPQPNHSHFTSFDIWHTANARGKAAGDGWIGKLLSNLYPEDPRVPHGYCIGQTVPYSFQSGTHPVVCFDTPSAYQFAADGKAIAGVTAKEMTAKESTLAKIRTTVQNASTTSAEVLKAVGEYKPRNAYPNSDLGRDLKLAAALLQSKIGCRIVSVTQNGYDTHENQKIRHDALMAELSQGVAAFLKDVQGTETGDRTLVVAFSEFGRRVADNASLGTDHGTAGPMFVAGTPVKGGLYGKHASLQDLDAGDLKFTTDFRRAYATVLSGWFGVQPDKVLGTHYEPIPFLKA
jgi:uncharacterized protein (DUF1501 family)